MTTKPAARTYTQAEQRILASVKGGTYVRVIDGRAGDSFVDIKALNTLIDEGVLLTKKQSGLLFVVGVA